MDRLWDVWTRKQQILGLPYLPAGSDLTTFSNEQFLFFVDGQGNYVTNGKAGDYLGMERFDYSYEPGSGEDVVSSQVPAPAATAATPSIPGAVSGNAATFAIPGDAVRAHLSRAASLVAEVTLERASTPAGTRELDVLVGAPATVAQASASSPYYAGTIAFFGAAMRMPGGMGGAATFSVPLPRRAELFAGPQVGQGVSIGIRLAATRGGQSVPALITATVSIR